jgi:membrane dipeptidase
MAAFLSVEGAELLDCSAAGLEKARALGVRMVNITWNGANILSGSNAQEPERGLSEAGRAFFKKLQDLHMIADMSHISEKGFFDCAALSEGPIVDSHSNSAKVFHHRRNLTDEQFCELIRLNGVAGINLYADFLGDNPGIEHIVAHIEHFCALGGKRTSVWVPTSTAATAFLKA